MSAKSLLESLFTKLGLYRLNDNGHGSNSGITEWWVIRAVRVVNSFVKPCNKQKDSAYSYYSFWILDYSYFRSPSIYDWEKRFFKKGWRYLLINDNWKKKEINRKCRIQLSHTRNVCFENLDFKNPPAMYSICIAEVYKLYNLLFLKLFMLTNNVIICILPLILFCLLSAWLKWFCKWK